MCPADPDGIPFSFLQQTCSFLPMKAVKKCIAESTGCPCVISSCASEFQSVPNLFALRAWQ